MAQAQQESPVPKQLRSTDEPEGKSLFPIIPGNKARRGLRGSSQSPLTAEPSRRAWFSALLCYSSSGELSWVAEGLAEPSCLRVGRARQEPPPLHRCQPDSPGRSSPSFLLHEFQKCRGGFSFGSTPRPAELFCPFLIKLSFSNAMTFN